MSLALCMNFDTSVFLQEPSLSCYDKKKNICSVYFADACLTRCSFIEMDLHSALTGGVRAQATKHADRWICGMYTSLS